MVDRVHAIARFEMYLHRNRLNEKSTGGNRPDSSFRKSIAESILAIELRYLFQRTSQDEVEME